LTTFAAYFDESGDSRSPILAVGGGVASAQKWVKFERAWKSILADYGASSLHMKDLYVNRREFEGWKGHDSDKEEMLRRLALCIRQFRIQTVTLGLVIHNYREVNGDYQLDEEIGHPYPLCALAGVAYVQGWARDQTPPISNENIQFVFEHGAEHKGQFIKQCKKLMHVEPILTGKEKVPLQLADFVAWEYRRNFKNMKDILESDEYRPYQERDTYQIIKRSKCHIGKYMMSRQLRELCEQFGVSRRSGKVSA
jgi:hypothetical protein